MLPSSLQNLDPKVAERFREIVQVPAKFDTPKEQEACETIVEQLSSDELESAANISYAYWALSKLEDSTASNEAARNIALKIARWHLQYVGGAKNSSNTNKALKRLQQALEIRKVSVERLIKRYVKGRPHICLSLDGMCVCVYGLGAKDGTFSYNL